jgi:RNA polymerase sigma-70 factor (ECF subfamily)
MVQSRAVDQLDTTKDGEPREVDEEQLLSGLRAGDEAAFEELIRAFGGRMLAAARRILNSEEDAQDALQDAFLSAFRKIDSFAGQAKLGTWLHRVAINAALMKLRTRNRRREREMGELLPKFSQSGHFESTPARWGEAADGPAIRHEIQDVVRKAIDQLPDNYRIALLLRDIEELSNDELAKHLGVTVNAAKIRVHRARMALKEALDPIMRAS